MDGAKSRSRGRTPKASKPKTDPVRSKAAGVSGNATVNPDERRRMIALSAYYRAEQRGFTNGDPVQDWLEAEAEVAKRLRDVEADKPLS